jgi:hypothetical protein
LIGALLNPRPAQADIRHQRQEIGKRLERVEERCAERLPARFNNNTSTSAGASRDPSVHDQNDTRQIREDGGHH